MTYEVRKDGRTYMGTDHENCRYPPETEASMQAAGYDIYIDGKRQPKRRTIAPKRAGNARGGGDGHV